MNIAANNISIGLAGSFTVDPLAKHLEIALGSKGFNKPEFYIAPYNQINQLSFNPEKLLGGAPDYLIVLWRLEDIGIEELDSLISAIQTLRQNYKGTLIVSNSPYPSTANYDVHGLEQPITGDLAYHQAITKFTQAIKDIDNIKILNLSGPMNDIGASNAHDIRKWYLYKQPYTEKFWQAIAKQSARIIAAQTIAAKKCIVLDCDNTLWGGIIGEEGIGGIEIGQEFPGSAYQDFQKHLLHLRSKGLFLAIASKNNEEEVFEVFDNHDAMILKRDHISAWQIHWNSKVEGLKAIADDLNISMDALVFVDDNPKEIAEVQERLPDVACFLVPEEIAEFPNLLRNTGLFDIADITEEDKKRADMMLAETKRKTANETMSEEDFIKSLELKIKIFEAQPQHLGRITQLINKTNQFNITTIRRTADEVTAIANDPDTILLGMDISDRFGEYGLVGVSILKKSSETEWDIDGLMMSCRVLGRGAETSLIAKSAEAVLLKGGSKLTGRYIPTPKNKLVENIFKDHGFTKSGDTWSINIKDAQPPPDYVDCTLKMLKS